MFLYRDHWTSMSLGKGEGIDDKSDKNYIGRRTWDQKKWCPSNNLMYFFLGLNLIFLVWSSVQRLTRKAHPRVYQCIWDNYVILAQKYHNSTTLSIWVVYAYISKNAIVSKDVIFYLLRYNVINWNSHIYKKYLFLSFHSLLFLVNNTGKVIEFNWQCETL